MIMFNPGRKCRYEKCDYEDKVVEKHLHDYVVTHNPIKYYHLECYNKMEFRRRLGLDRKTK